MTAKVFDVHQWTKLSAKWFYSLKSLSNVHFEPLLNFQQNVYMDQEQMIKTTFYKVSIFGSNDLPM